MTAIWSLWSHLASGPTGKNQKKKKRITILSRTVQTVNVKRLWDFCFILGTDKYVWNAAESGIPLRAFMLGDSSKWAWQDQGKHRFNLAGTKICFTSLGKQPIKVGILDEDEGRRGMNINFILSIGWIRVTILSHWTPVLGIFFFLRLWKANAFKNQRQDMENLKCGPRSSEW